MIVIKCGFCDRYVNVRTSPEKMNEWVNTERDKRPLIQNFFPELNSNEREIILSGMCENVSMKLSISKPTTRERLS